MIFLLAVMLTIALIYYVHSTSYPHIDDVMREMDEEKNRANKCPSGSAFCDASTACLVCE